MKEEVRIVVVGDEKVGKTSIIEVLITATFEENVQPVLPVLVVPKDVTPEKVKVSIVDTPGGMDQAAKVDEELRLADVVVLVYSVSDERSQERVKSYWLKKFRRSALKVPIILVGNKIDARGGIENPTATAVMEAYIKPIMDNYREVDVCIECSAKTVSNISEVFYFAQKAVLHPTGPLYDVDSHALKAPAANALKRIFRLCDKDRDGGLNDKELNDFQYACFNVHLKDDELSGVKKVVYEHKQESGIRPDGSISVEGFIFLHTLFIQKGRLETTWIVLRKFGYDDNMRLILNPADEMKCAADQSIELSPAGKSFVSNLFATADKDNDGLISKAELGSIFAEHPDEPFSIAGDAKPCLGLTRAGPKGKEEYCSLDAFLSRWAVYVQDSPNDAILALQYIGYTEPPTSALRVTKSRSKDRYYKNVSREVLSVFVLGSDGASNCDLVRGLAGRPPTKEAVPNLTSATIFSGDEGSSGGHVLVMRAVTNTISELVVSRDIQKADVLCITFSAASQESFEYAKNAWEELSSTEDVVVPVVFVASVDDGEDGSIIAEADSLCLQAQIPTPVRVSLREGETAGLFDDLLGVATHPDVACPGYYESSGTSTMLKVAIGTLVFSGTLYAAKRVYDYYSSKPSAN